jgi:hypothetical protein
LTEILNVSPEHVTVIVKHARRRLLITPVIAVDFEIGVTDFAAAVNMQARIKAGRCRLNPGKPCVVGFSA